MLVNHVSPTIYEFISECEDYAKAIDMLEKLYIAPQNEILARHLLATRRQQPGESLNEYLNVLKLLAKECNFKAFTATEYREEMIRDAFINCVQSHCIRQRLLEKVTLDFEAAYTQARSLEIAEKSSNTYNSSLSINSLSTENVECNVNSAVKPKGSCHFCGGARHNSSNAMHEMLFATIVAKSDTLQKFASPEANQISLLLLLYQPLIAPHKFSLSQCLRRGSNKL